MTAEATVQATLADIFRRVFGAGQAALDERSTSQTIAGWDSFKYVQVIVELETHYGIALDGPEIDEVTNVGDLIRLVSDKVSDGKGGVPLDCL